MRVLVCGGRDFRDAEYLQQQLDIFHESRPVTLLIHGAQRGADLLAENWARSREVAYVGVPAEWRKQKRAAGPIRNRRMITEWAPEWVIAFPGGTGTADMMAQARDVPIPVYEILSR